MVPTLLVGDFILVNKFTTACACRDQPQIVDAGSPQRGDVMVFRYPRIPRSTTSSAWSACRGPHRIPQQAPDHQRRAGAAQAGRRLPVEGAHAVLEALRRDAGQGRAEILLEEDVPPLSPVEDCPDDLLLLQRFFSKAVRNPVQSVPTEWRRCRTCLVAPLRGPESVSRANILLIDINMHG